MLFIELTLTNGKKCTIQVNKICGIFTDANNKCIVDTGRYYHVMQSYEEVVKMIQYYSKVKWVAV